MLAKNNKKTLVVCNMKLLNMMKDLLNLSLDNKKYN